MGIFLHSNLKKAPIIKVTRAMRILIMFDVPSVTKTDLRNYRNWRKFLDNSGFIMMTESVYSRLCINKSTVTSIRKLITTNLPPKGDVQLLEITERQFSSIEYLLGEAKTKVLNDGERFTEL